jgi:hypothetical protein
MSLHDRFLTDLPDRVDQKTQGLPIGALGTVFCQSRAVQLKVTEILLQAATEQGFKTLIDSDVTRLPGGDCKATIWVPDQRELTETVRDCPEMLDAHVNDYLPWMDRFAWAVVGPRYHPTGAEVPIAPGLIQSASDLSFHIPGYTRFMRDSDMAIYCYMLGGELQARTCKNRYGMTDLP